MIMLSLPRRRPLTRLAAALALAVGLLLGESAVPGGQSFAATQTDATAAEATSCPSVTGTVSSSPNAAWLAQQASQSFATEKLAASPRTSRWVSLRFHGVLEWPSVVFDGIRYPGVSELAALQSAAFGVPNDRHREVTRMMPGPDGTRMPHSLLTEIAAYGRFPRMGSPYCRKSAKESVVSSA
ncbi:hypothetical protein [Streptomyces sp. NPDC101776]|uniref:hypothetical protein n=1 Tax=Streptomyces sp. NPDC101776 TaxID=3366146 RepID=UPI003819F4BE